MRCSVSSFFCAWRRNFFVAGERSLFFGTSEIVEESSVLTAGVAAIDVLCTVDFFVGVTVFFVAGFFTATVFFAEGALFAAAGFFFAVCFDVVGFDAELLFFVVAIIIFLVPRWYETYFMT